mgnify:CR=1 FL=1
MEPMDEETFTQEENEAWQAFAQALPTYTLDDPITTIVFESKEMDEEDWGIIVTYRGKVQ